MKTTAYDLRAFCRGELVKSPTNERPWSNVSFAFATGAATGMVMFLEHGMAQTKTMMETAVPALTSHPAMAPATIDHAFDPVIAMLQQIAFPVASIVLAWACLQAMVGKPAAAVDRAKWAVLGYLAMRYAPEILRHI